MDIQILGKRVLVDVEKTEEEKSPGGLFIPDNLKKKPLMLKGKVVAVGPEAADTISVNDTVYFYPAHRVNFEADGMSYGMLNVEDIVGVKKN
jgi:chaperonin GroES